MLIQERKRPTQLHLRQWSIQDCWRNMQQPTVPMVKFKKIYSSSKSLLIFLYCFCSKLGGAQGYHHTNDFCTRHTQYVMTSLSPGSPQNKTTHCQSRGASPIVFQQPSLWMAWILGSLSLVNWSVTTWHTLPLLRIVIVNVAVKAPSASTYEL